jgi:hypothetical protein
MQMLPDAPVVLGITHRKWLIDRFILDLALNVR